MDLKLYPTEDLLAELIRRDAIRILQATQYVDSATILQNLGLKDELLAFKISQVQAEMGRVLSEDVTVQLIGHRKLKTSASEEIKLTVMLVGSAAMKKLVALSENPPSPDVGIRPEEADEEPRR
jgi:hypothetical protein